MGLFMLIQGSSRLPERSARVVTSRLNSTSAPWIGLMSVDNRSRTGWGIQPGRVVSHACYSVDVENDAVDCLQVTHQRGFMRACSVS